MKYIQDQDCQADADATDGVEEEETARDLRFTICDSRMAARLLTPALSSVEEERGGRLESPKLVPDEVVDHRDLGRADFAEGDVPAQSARIGEQVKNPHVHKHATAADEAEFGELDKSFRTKPPHPGPLPQGRRGRRHWDGAQERGTKACDGYGIFLLV
jgi:hypothetical protein